MAGPLQGIKILDLSRVLAGPWASQVLADLGAEVIKVERPGSGDDTRGWGPPFLKDGDGNETSDAVYTLACNRGKRSLALDIATPEGQEIARKLAARADILIENFRVGALEKYGLDYDSLAAANWGLIYCSITGFGQTGPYADKAGYDFLIQGMGGLMSITGTPETGPLKTGVAIADITTGMYAAIAVLGALHHRDKTGGREEGEGQFIDMALLDTQVSWLANQNMNWLAGGVEPGPAGNNHPNLVPYGPYQAADGQIIIAVGNDRQFAVLSDVLARPELAEDKRFARNRDRVANRDALKAILEEAMAGESCAHWQAEIEAAGIAVGPINSIREVFEDPQVIARGLRCDLPHAAAGTVPSVRSPFLFSATPPEYTKGPPLLGQHSDDVLAELGFGEDKIADLRAKGVIG